MPGSLTLSTNTATTFIVYTSTDFIKTSLNYQLNNQLNNLVVGTSAINDANAYDGFLSLSKLVQK